MEIFEKKNVKLIHGDIKEEIKKLPDYYFDAIITDPPYGINFDKYDKSNDIFFELEDEFFRVLKKDGWFIFWWTVKKIPEVARFRKFQYKWMIIAEFQGTISKCAIGDRTYSPIFVFAKGEPKVKARIRDTIVAMEMPQILPQKIKQGDFKPTIAQSILLSIFAGKDGRVLDPFAGFGSLLLSSLLTGIGQVIGIEKDPIRYKIAKLILEQESIPLPIPEMIKKFERNEKIEEKSLFIDKEKNLYYNSEVNQQNASTKLG